MTKIYTWRPGADPIAHLELRAQALAAAARLEVGEAEGEQREAA